MKISGLVVASELELGCYPYIESISSFLPVVDELVVAFNVYGRKDGSREKIEALSDKIRIVSTVFDIERYGWISYGIARTTGYQACKGDIVLMFDADGVLHEKDHETLVRQVDEFSNTPNKPTGYWEKHRFYQPTVYYSQHKHSGVYNKKILGDRFDFMMPNGKGAPNFSRLESTESRSYRLTVTLFGYEHLWDTREVLEYKVNRYGRMIDGLHGDPFKTPEEYFDAYMHRLIGGLVGREKGMDVSQHPEIMQNKLKTINQTHFGHSFFGMRK